MTTPVHRTTYRLLLLLLVVVVLCAIAASTAVSAQVDNPSADMEGVVAMDAISFDALVGKDKAALVEFYAPWCGHCKTMAGEYARLGAAHAASPKSQAQLVIGKVDATQHSALAHRLDVQGYPTVLYFPPKDAANPVKYTRAREAEEFAKYLREQVSGLDLFIPQMPIYITELDADSFHESVTKKRGTYQLILFYTTWCSGCKTVKTLMNDVARVFQNEERVVIAQMNTDSAAAKAIAEEAGVSGYPTILFYPFGSLYKKPEEYTAPHTLSGLVDFVNKQAHTTRGVNGDVSDRHGLSDSLTTALRKMVNSIDVDDKFEEASADFFSAGAGMRGETVHYYTKLSQHLKKDRTTAFLDSELARLERILAAGGSGAAAGRRRDSMMARRNIINAVKTGRTVLDEEQQGNQKLPSYKDLEQGRSERDESVKAE